MTRVPTFGVLITYYGERELLTECLESLAAQSVQPDEIVVYDDASVAPAAAYIPSNLNVGIIRGQTNRGPAFGRNALLHGSTSRYVHFHDADDLFAANWCSKVRDVIGRQEPDVIFTEVQSFGENGVGNQQVLGLERLRQDEDLVRFCIRGAMLTPSGTYRREAVLGIGGYRTDLVQSEDWDFHVRLAATAPRFEVILEPLVCQRLRAAGRHQRRVEVWTSCCAAIDLLADQLPLEYRRDLADAAARAGSQLFALGARAEARTAFQLAECLGPPRAEHRPRAYRVLARTMGFQRAEELAEAYRKVVPSRLRAHVR